MLQNRGNSKTSPVNLENFKKSGTQKYDSTLYEMFRIGEIYEVKSILLLVSMGCPGEWGDE